MCEYTETAKLQVQSACPKDQGRFNPISENAPLERTCFLTLFCFVQHGLQFVGPRFDKLVPKPCKSWSDVAYNGVWSGSYCLLFFFGGRNTWV